MTLLALLFRIIAGPLANVLQKQICAQGQSPLITNFVTYLLLAFAVLPWTITIPWGTYPAAFWYTAVLIGIFGGLGNGFLVQAVRCGELSVLGPINAYKSVVGIVTGFILLGEIPRLAGIAGILLIIFGSYYVLDTLPEHFSWKLLYRKEFQYRFAAMVLTAVEAVFIKKVILYSDPYIAFVVWCWGGALCSLLFLLILKNISRKSQIVLTLPLTTLSSVLSFFALTFCVGVMQFATNYVFERMPVGYALALFQLSALLSVVFGYCFFGETAIIKKLVGAVVMILGSVLIILQGTG